MGYISILEPTHKGVWHSISMLNFARLSDGTLSVSIKEECKTIAENIVIPKTYNGRTVTTIASKGFYDCTYLQSVKIPDSIVTIEDHTFYSCTSLQSVELPDSIVTIEDYAFYRCASLQSVELPDSLVTIGYAAFQGCTKLTNITLPDNVTDIGQWAFKECSSLKSINIPSKVKFMGNGVFEGCPYISKVYFDNPTGWSCYIVSSYGNYNWSSIPSSSLSDPSTAAKTLKTYVSNQWKHSY